MCPYHNENPLIKLYKCKICGNTAPGNGIDIVMCTVCRKPMEAVKRQYWFDTVHPKTGRIEHAEWLEDHFGLNKFGVRFPSDGRIYKSDKCRIKGED
jgi:hypothetical protein